MIIRITLFLLGLCAVLINMYTAHTISFGLQEDILVMGYAGIMIFGICTIIPIIFIPLAIMSKD